MAFRISTALANALMDTASLKTAMASCFIDIYTGSQPATANAAPTGTKLVTLTVNGDGVTGLTFEASATDGILEKNAGEVWQGTAVASGTAGWFRIRLAADGDLVDNAAAKKRIDGSIATSGGDINVGSLSVTSGAPFILSSYSITMPQT